MRILHFLIALLFLSACSSDYGNEDIIEDIKSNNPDRIIKNFYKKHKLEKEEFKEVVGAYSKFLQSADLTQIEFDDQFSFKKRKRHGYMYINKDNNFVASVTFKYVLMPDSSYQVNFIDFRNSTSELPCVKFPSKFPIKCLAMPVPHPPKVDSLKTVYPKEIHNHKFFHASMASEKYVEAAGDTLKRIIALNNGNALIGRNLESILGKIDEELGLEYYTLCESNKIGEPTINISYDPEVHFDYEIEALKSILEETTGAEIRVRQQKTIRMSWGYTNPMISIGYPLSEARVKIF